MKKLSLIILLFLIAKFSFAQTVSVNGKCFLIGQNQTDHSQIAVKFTQIAPNTNTYTFITDVGGNYFGNIENGFYNITYNYLNAVSGCTGSISLSNINLFNNTTFPDTSITHGFGGTLQGNTIWQDTIVVECALTVNSGDTLTIMPNTHVFFRGGITINGVVDFKTANNDSIFLAGKNGAGWSFSYLNAVDTLNLKNIDFQNCSRIYGGNVGTTGNGGGVFWIYANQIAHLKIDNESFENYTFVGFKSVMINNSELESLKFEYCNLNANNTTIFGNSYIKNDSRTRMSYKFYNSKIENISATFFSATYSDTIELNNSKISNVNVLMGGNQSRISKFNLNNCYVSKISTMISGGSYFQINNAKISNSILEKINLFSTNGFYSSGYSSIEIYNSTIPQVLNTQGSSNLTLNCYNTIFGGRTGDAVLYAYNCNFSGAPIQTNQCCESVLVYENTNGDSIDVYGNFSIPVNYVDSANGNFRLMSGDASIDAGNNNNSLSLLDYDSLNRIWDGNSDNIAIVDMGAYEHGSESSLMNEIGITSITSPSNSCTHISTENITFKVRNFGNVNAKNFNMSYSLDSGVTWVNEVYTDSILITKENQITFSQKADLSAPGRYPILIAVSLVGDARSYNDTLMKIVESYNMNIQFSDIKNPKCFGLANGEARAVVSGAPGPYIYLWSNSTNSTTSYPKNLSNGWNIVTITTPGGCYKKDSVYLQEPARLIIGLDSTNATCNSINNDGTAIALPTGGTQPYSYLWNNPSNTALANLTGMAPYVNYTVTVKDSNNCSAQRTVKLQTLNNLISGITKKDISCAGLTDGKAYVAPSGGTPNYTVIWNGTTVADSITDLSSGQKTVYIQDATGCFVRDTIDIIQPNAMNVSFTDSILVACHGKATGSLTSFTTGGVAPYSYAWDNSPSTLPTANNIDSRLHTLTVTDINGCKATKSQFLSQADSIVLSANIISPKCFGGNDGFIDLQVVGGTKPYNYGWSTGTNSEDISGLPASVYSILLSDKNNCTVIRNYVVHEPKTMSLTSFTNTVTCHNECDGWATAIVSNGTPPYSYFWSNGDINDTISMVCSGVYNVTVTDSNGCKVTENNIIVNNTNALGVTFITIPSACADLQGGANALGYGGTPPYRYNWSNGDTTTSVSYLSPGIHSITVEDDKNCSIKKDFPIKSISSLVLSGVTIGNVTCGGDATGFINISIGGGMPPYKVIWSNGATSEDVSGLTVGEYWVVVEDANGCKQSATYTVNGPNKMQIKYTAFSPNCSNNDGIIDLAVSGGTPTYNYLWSNGSLSADQSNLSANIYEVKVIDANGCIDSAIVDLSNISGPNITSVINHIECGATTGSISVSTSHASDILTWENASSSPTRNGLLKGLYKLSVKDTNGCITNKSFILENKKPQTPELCLVDVDSDIGGNRITWNPIWDNIVTGYFLYRETTQAGVYQKIATIDSSINTIYIDSSALPAIRSYRYKLSSYNACGAESDKSELHKTIHLNINVGVSNTVNLIWEDYEGYAIPTYYINRYTTGNGWQIIDSIPSNITSYTDLNPGLINGDLQYFISGNKDENCNPYEKANTYGSTRSNKDDARIGNSKLNIITSGSSPFSCTGQANITLSDATAPLTYIWDDSIQYTLDSVAYNLCPGTYWAIVIEGGTDSNYVEFEILADSSNFLSAISTVLAIDSGNCTGMASVQVKGGKKPYTILWDGNTGNQIDTLAKSLCAGTYSASIKDFNGLSTIVFVTIPNNTGIAQTLKSFIFNVYPNPFSNSTLISFDNQNNENYKLILYNSLGERIKSIETNSNVIELSSESLPAGVYFLHLNSESNSASKKVVIMK